ncbi:MAG: alanine racemase, partial [Peristeroidobacter soli]
MRISGVSSQPDASTLEDLETPALILDEGALDRNLTRMRTHLATLGVPLRPHIKTAKCIEIIRRALEGQPPAVTVSTLKEAEYCLAHGIRDIVYAVGIAPVKLRHACDLIAHGASLTLTLDNAAAVAAVAQSGTGAGVVVPILIELDVDGHRSGIVPESEQLLELGVLIARTRGVELRGVLTHAGESYQCRSIPALRQMAERERVGAVRAAER